MIPARCVLDKAIVDAWDAGRELTPAEGDAAEAACGCTWCSRRKDVNRKARERKEAGLQR